MQVVVHRPSTTAVWLWIQAELGERAFTLLVCDDGGEVQRCWPGPDQLSDLASPGRAPVTRPEVAPPGGSASTPELRAQSWEPGQRDPDHLLTNVAPLVSDTRVWWVPLSGLTAGRWYSIWHLPATPPKSGRVRLRTRVGRHRLEAERPVVLARFRALPDSLRNGPLRILLASCYCEDLDRPAGSRNPVARLITDPNPPRWTSPLLWVLRRMRRGLVAARSASQLGPVAGATGSQHALQPSTQEGTVARAFAELLNSPLSPDLKILVGDQVYLDAPIRTLLAPLSQTRMKRHISRTYSRTWQKLNPLLSYGGNFFLSDDHEYWNNYPGVPGWPALLPRVARDRWELQARAFMTAIQAPAALLTFDIGTPKRELAFCLVDTRMHRQRPSWPGAKTDRFMTDADLAALCSWIRDLNVPGVLVLGQPLLADPARHWWQRALDRGLPDYEKQYRILCEALRDASNDVLILSGDIHYARAAVINLDDRAHTLHELVSSPLTLVPGAAGHYDCKALSMTDFPIGQHPQLGAIKFSDPLTGTGVPCPDHFMMLGFTSDDGGSVRVDVTAHQVRPPREYPDEVVPPPIAVSSLELS